MYHLARFPEFTGEGFVSPLSAQERWKLLIAAAEAGHVEAQRDARAYLATGDFEPGWSSDLPAAVGWYSKAAAAGHADAQFNLATMLLLAEVAAP
jgi:TPR repeat protein